MKLNAKLRSKYSRRNLIKYLGTLVQGWASGGLIETACTGLVESAFSRERVHRQTVVPGGQEF